LGNRFKQEEKSTSQRGTQKKRGNQKGAISKKKTIVSKREKFIREKMFGMF